MDNEAQLLKFLIDGPCLQKSIPMAKSSRFKAAKILENKGMLLRDQDGWRLTKDGIHYAIGKGILPTVKNFFQYADEPTDEVMHMWIKPVDSRTWPRFIASILLLGAWVHIAMVLVMHYSGWAQIW